ncbi:MAG: hypothetical protein ABI780_04225 [Ardenticatenales bacterium]
MATHFSTDGRWIVVQGDSSTDSGLHIFGLPPGARRELLYMPYGTTLGP